MKPRKPATSKSAKSSAKAPAKTSVIRGKAHIYSSKVAWHGKVFSVISEDVREPNGIRSNRDLIRHNGSIVVLAVDESNPTDPLILIERQYRHAAGQFLLELPAGRIDEGEAALHAAKRELIEETGYRAKRWTKLVRYYASPGFLGETMQIYLAQDIRAGLAEPEDDESIEIRFIPLSEVLKMIDSGVILDGKTLIGVQYYARHRHEL